MSRGEFVASFLDPADHILFSEGANSLRDYAAMATSPPSSIASGTPGAPIVPVDVGGFNLLLLEPVFAASPISASDSPVPQVTFDAVRLSNSGTQTPLRARVLADASTRATASGRTSCEGMSNEIDGGAVDGLGITDPWTKVSNGKKQLEGVLSAYANPPRDDEELEKVEMQLVDDLMQLLGYAQPLYPPGFLWPLTSSTLSTERARQMRSMPSKTYDTIYS